MFPFTIEVHVVKQTSIVFFYWWAKCRCVRVPWKLCCGIVTLQRAQFRVSAWTDGLFEALTPPICAVTSSTYLFGWTDHGAVTATSGANPQTEAPWPSSLPCQRHDAAPSVNHTSCRALRHYIPVAPGRCASRANSGASKVSSGDSYGDCSYRG